LLLSFLVFRRLFNIHRVVVCFFVARTVVFFFI
jgi:hypothetical protein